MSETVLKFGLHELLTVRVRCQKCNGPVLELPVDKLGEVLDDKGRCRFCGEVIMLPSENRLAELSQAIQTLKKSPHIHVEFVLPEKGK